MDPHRIIRWSGVAAVLFGILLVAAALVERALTPERGSAAHLVVGTLRVTALIFAVFAATGIYARHARATGPLALAGYVLAVVGLVLTLSNEAFFAFVDPWVIEQAPQIEEGFREGTLSPPATHVGVSAVADVALLAGLVLLLGGVARARILPAGALWTALAGGVLAVVGALVHPLLASLGEVAVGVGVAWMGYALWAEGRGPAGRDATRPGASAPEP